MMSSWWFLWMVFMFFMLVSPVSYGWGYRGWGPPYPSYLQKRRSAAATATGSTGPFRHESWGWGGDFVWVMFFVGALWISTALWWPLWFR